ncbi:MAG: hypothetical protein HFG50_11220 [Lachnospiraceae bacterium]|jgi:hypothetical protein|nr:hypothetical protein [Lachnospiraceae bacterium]
MDMLLGSNGDLLISPQGDIVLGESVAQKINIRLKWFEGEWRWNKEEGLPYLGSLFVKNPDTDSFEALVRRKIFEVKEVTEVKDVSVIYDNKSRKGMIRYAALTDREMIKGEVKLLCPNME